MSANSLLRRAAKATLHPFLNENTYSYVQALAKAIDIRRGTSAEPELDLIPFAVNPGDDVLDLGANYGFYTYPLSRAVGPSGHVYAFEPVPFTFRSLALVTRILGVRNATLVPKGCSDAAGRISFTVPVQQSGALGAGQAYIATRNDDRPGAETQVRWTRTTRVESEVVALDEFLPPLRRLSLIKCDIEGAELLAFRGATRTIETHRPCVICEINPWFLDGFGLRLQDLVSFFVDRGYGMYRYVAKRLVPVTSLADVVEDNYVFLHGDRLAPFRPLIDAR
jgi:FkbM family methyltransferase